MVDLVAVAGGIKCDRHYDCDLSDDRSNALGCIPDICTAAMRENKYAPNPRPVLEVVFDGCQEVRDSVFGATVITVVVFATIFALTGVEGSIFVPMGLGYLSAVLASSVVALTVTPALCAILLPHSCILAHPCQR